MWDTPGYVPFYKEPIRICSTYRKKINNNYQIEIGEIDQYYYHNGSMTNYLIINDYDVVRDKLAITYKYGKEVAMEYYSKAPSLSLGLWYDKPLLKITMKNGLFGYSVSSLDKFRKSQLDEVVIAIEEACKRYDKIVKYNEWRLRHDNR